MLAEFDDLLGRVADDEERVPVCRDRRQLVAHHAAHQHDAPVGRAKMFISAVGDDALLLNRHAVLVAYVDAPLRVFDAVDQHHIVGAIFGALPMVALQREPVMEA